jgi:rRNA-processing protein FCF1
MIQVILDTNILLVPAQFSVDIFSEIDRLVAESHELCVLDKTLDELNQVAKTADTGKDKRAAMLGIAFVAGKKMKVLATKEGHPDDIIVELSERGKQIVATQDMNLKRRLKEKGVSVLTMRSQTHLIRVDV